MSRFCWRGEGACGLSLRRVLLYQPRHASLADRVSRLWPDAWNSGMRRCSAIITNIPAWTASAARSGATRRGFAYRQRRHGDAACQLDRQELPGSTIVRDGAAETPVLTIDSQTARWQDTPDQCSVEGCGWDATLEFTVAAEWPSGAYRITRDRRRPRRQADLLRPSDHRQAGAGAQARPHPAGGRDRHLDGLQHLGRLQPLSGHHRAQARPVRAGRQHRAAAGAAASSGCRRMRRACRWRSRCRR